jgi:hypothetical protein
LFTYVRYNAELGKEYLNSIGITNLSDKEIESLTELDNANNAERLMAIGEKASAEISDSHFPAVFDIKTVYD